MALAISVPDLPTDNTGFQDRFVSFSVNKERDGQGGFVIMGTATLEALDSNGQLFKTVSLTKELPPAAAASLRDFIKTHYLDAIKLQENL